MKNTEDDVAGNREQSETVTPQQPKRRLSRLSKWLIWIGAVLVVLGAALAGAVALLFHLITNRGRIEMRPKHQGVKNAKHTANQRNDSGPACARLGQQRNDQRSQQREERQERYDVVWFVIHDALQPHSKTSPKTASAVLITLR